jgi:hypothetical protein
MNETKPGQISDPKPVLSLPKEPITREPLHPEDFYMEGPYLVFTTAYHLRRGYCCNSNCRHCPYK